MVKWIDGLKASFRREGAGSAKAKARLEDLRRDVDAAIERLQKGTAPESDFCVPSDARMDGKAAWVAGMIGRATLHEPEFGIFGRFQPSMGTILDVGANWGYSVGSIRASGCKCPILSFEVLQPYAECLEAAKRALGKGYDYIIAGVGSKRDELEFFTPVIDNCAITALTTARPDALGYWTSMNVVAYAETLKKPRWKFDFKFLRTVAKVDRIDVLIKQPDLSVPTTPIAAIKIDVEGFEADALAGASATIARDRPLLLLEGGNRAKAVDKFLVDAGYVVAEFSDGGLMLSDGMSKAVNGIFIHRDRFEEYREAGILALA